MKRRFVPVVTESVVISLLLAALIYGAVTSATSSGACSPLVAEEEGDGDDAEDGSDGGGVGASNRACALTKASTGMTVSTQ